MKQTALLRRAICVKMASQFQELMDNTGFLRNASALIRSKQNYLRHAYQSKFSVEGSKFERSKNEKLEHLESHRIWMVDGAATNL